MPKSLLNGARTPRPREPGAVAHDHERDEFQPSLRDLYNVAFTLPTLKRWAIVGNPSGMMIPEILVALEFVIRAMLANCNTRTRRPRSGAKLARGPGAFVLIANGCGAIHEMLGRACKSYRIIENDGIRPEFTSLEFEFANGIEVFPRHSIVAELGDFSEGPVRRGFGVKHLDSGDFSCRIAWTHGHFYPACRTATSAQKHGKGTNNGKEFECFHNIASVMNPAHQE